MCWSWINCRPMMINASCGPSTSTPESCYTVLPDGSCFWGRYPVKMGSEMQITSSTAMDVTIKSRTGAVCDKKWQFWVRHYLSSGWEGANELRVSIFPIEWGAKDLRTKSFSTIWYLYRVWFPFSLHLFPSIFFVWK